MFLDRADGGRSLAEKLRKYRGQDVVVFGLPRGGVATARVVADELNAPLDLIITRKIGHPGNPEYALGAVTDDGETAYNRDALNGVSPEWLEQERLRQLEEAERRRLLYLESRPPISVNGRIAILVDDGIATGYTMEAAILSLRKRQPAKIVVAAPVAPESAVRRFAALADEVVIVEAPELFFAIGQWYEDFSQLADEDVLELMRKTPVVT
ncbi:MAG: phosphoribosyltransferase [Fimbriimonadales bacterium]